MQTDEQFTVARVGSDAGVGAAKGEIDVASTPRFEAALDRANRVGSGFVVADLCAVTYLDSGGLSTLLTCAQKLRANGGELVVVTDDPRIVAVIERVRLDVVVRLERSLADALREVLPRPAVA